MALLNTSMLSMSWGEVVEQELGYTPAAPTAAPLAAPERTPSAARHAATTPRTELDLLAESSRDGINLLLKQSMKVSYASAVSGASEAPAVEAESAPQGATPGMKAGRKRREREEDAPSSFAVPARTPDKSAEQAATRPTRRVTAKRTQSTAVTAVEAKASAATTAALIAKDARVRSSVSYAAAIAAAVGAPTPSGTIPAAVFDNDQEETRMELPASLPVVRALSEGAAPLSRITEDAEMVDDADFVSVTNGRGRSGSGSSGKLVVQSMPKKARMSGKQFMSLVASAVAAPSNETAPGASPGHAVRLPAGVTKLHKWGSTDSTRAESAAVGPATSSISHAELEPALVQAASPAQSAVPQLQRRDSASTAASATSSHAAPKPVSWAARVTGKPTDSAADVDVAGDALDHETAAGDELDESMAVESVTSALNSTHAPIEELTEHRIVQREKQITIGKSTEGYRRYSESIPVDSRVPGRFDHPQTPDRMQHCSKRHWDHEVRVWRRRLHLWDSAAPTVQLRASPRMLRAKARSTPESPVSLGLTRSVSSPSQ